MSLALLPATLVDDTGTPNGALFSASFNQDASCLALAWDSGFAVFSILPFMSTFVQSHTPSHPSMKTKPTPKEDLASPSPMLESAPGAAVGSESKAQTAGGEDAALPETDGGRGEASEKAADEKAASETTLLPEISEIPMPDSISDPPFATGSGSLAADSVSLERKGDGNLLLRVESPFEKGLRVAAKSKPGDAAARNAVGERENLEEVETKKEAEGEKKEREDDFVLLLQDRKVPASEKQSAALIHLAEVLENKARVEEEEETNQGRVLDKERHQATLEKRREYGQPEVGPSVFGWSSLSALTGGLKTLGKVATRMFSGGHAIACERTTRTVQSLVAIHPLDASSSRRSLGDSGAFVPTTLSVRLSVPLFRSNLMAVSGFGTRGAATLKPAKEDLSTPAAAGGGPTELSGCKVYIWDDFHKQYRGEMSFRSIVRAIKIRREVIVVVLDTKIYVYNLHDLTLRDSIETGLNASGVCDITVYAPHFVLACPALQRGFVRIELYHHTPPSNRLLLCHEGNIVALALNSDGYRVATASDSGTLIRIWNTHSGHKLQEFRRGTGCALIHSLAFNSTTEWLLVTSNTGTLHVFCVAGSLTSRAKRLLLSKASPKPSSEVEQGVTAEACVSDTGCVTGDACVPAISGTPANSISVFARTFNPDHLPTYLTSTWSFVQSEIGSTLPFIARFDAEDLIHGKNSFLCFSNMLISLWYDSPRVVEQSLLMLESCSSFLLRKIVAQVCPVGCHVLLSVLFFFV